jgi:DNA-directed RNA polymerase
MLDLKAEQERLEYSVSIEAEARARKEYTEANSRTDYASSRIGVKFVKSIMNRPSIEGGLSFVDTIKEFLHKESQRRSGRFMVSATLLNESGIEPEVLALIAAKTILSHIIKMRSCKRSSLCMFIGRNIDLEVSMRRFQNTKERKNLVKKLFKDFDKRTYPKHWRVRTIKNYFDAEQVEWHTWEPKQHLSVGLAMLAMFRNATGLVTFSPDGTFVDISDVLAARVQDMLVSNSSMFALYRPMVMPPKPWTPTNLFRGGYYTSKVKPYAFIKGSVSGMFNG